MKHFLIALTCLALLSGSHLAHARKNAAADTAQEAGVKGGKVVGTPGPRSKFKNLRLGMSKFAVEKQIGEPDDVGSHITGKAFRPFYFGTDHVRQNAYYKGSGILVYSGVSNDNLVEIHHNENESGDRSVRR